MNYYNPPQNSFVRDETGRYRKAAHEVLDRMPGLAGPVVASGLSAKWARDLGWPAWVVHGTGLPPNLPIPNKIRLQDDLMILANLLDRVGPKFLLESILFDEEGAVSLGSMRVFMAAPNPAAILRFLVKAVNIQNAFIRVNLIEDRYRFLVGFSALPNSGQLGVFLEHSAATFVLRIMNSFQPKLTRMTGDRADWPALSLRDGDADALAVLSKYDQIDVASCADATTLSVAAPLLLRPNARHDADAWQQAYAALRRDWIGDGAPMSIEFVRLQIRHTLEISRRAPNLPELSRDLAMSPRTISRKLASLGKTFQEVVIEEKMELAKRRLQSGLAVDWVARSLGYSTSSSFGRAFQKISGMSPGAWRQRAQAGACA